MRVPARFATVEPRVEIPRTLGTTCHKEARQHLPAAKAAVVAALDRKLVIGINDHSREASEAAISMAASRGIVYRSAAELAEGPLELLLRHVEALGPRAGAADEKALLGGIELPKMRVSGLAAAYEELRQYENHAENDRQMRVWRHPMKRVVSDRGESTECDRVAGQTTGGRLALVSRAHERATHKSIGVETSDHHAAQIARVEAALLRVTELVARGERYAVSLMERAAQNLIQARSPLPPATHGASRRGRRAVPHAPETPSSRGGRSARLPEPRRARAPRAG